MCEGEVVERGGYEYVEVTVYEDEGEDVMGGGEAFGDEEEDLWREVKECHRWGRDVELLFRHTIRMAFFFS